MYRYVIIDDEALTRRGTMEKLSPMAQELQCIGEASDGQEGLALIETLHPEIVITDMKMPVMDGSQLLTILSEKYPDIFLIVISGYRDFDYMREAVRAKAVDYLLKPFRAEEIQEVVRKALHQLQEQEQESLSEELSRKEMEQTREQKDRMILQNMIENYHVMTPEFVSERYGSRLAYSDYFVLILYSEQALSEKHITEFLRQNRYSDRAIYLPHSTVDQTGYLFLTIPQGNLVSPETYSRQITEGLSQLFWDQRQNVRYGVGRVHSRIHEAAAAGKEAAAALDQQKIPEEETISYFQQEECAPRRLSWEHTDELVFCVEAGKTSEVQHLTENLFAFYRRHPESTISDVKFHLNYLQSQIRYVIGWSIPEISDRRRELRGPSRQDMLFSLDGLEEYTKQYLTNLTNNLAKEEIYGDEDLVKNVQTYIEHFYQKNISVALAAALFHVNRTYLSHIFKKKTGRSFIEYLNLVRITRAKELLDSSDKKMYQIALLSGYNNVRYFYRAFKKVEGMTPEEYRLRTTPPA